MEKPAKIAACIFILFNMATIVFVPESYHPVWLESFKFLTLFFTVILITWQDNPSS